MPEGVVPVPVPSKLFRELTEALGSCRDYAYQLHKDYVYDMCVRLQKEVQEFTDTWPEKPDEPDEDISYDPTGIQS